MVDQREREQMERFVRHLLQTMPLASLTIRIVFDRYKAKFNMDRGFTAIQSETLRSIVVEFAKAEIGKPSTFKVGIQEINTNTHQLIYFRPALETRSITTSLILNEIIKN